MRCKRPAPASMGDEYLIQELEAIQEACSDIHWFTDQDDDTLLNALDGDEEDAYEFRVAFADLEAKADHLSRLFYELGEFGDDVWRTYNDCTVARSFPKTYPLCGKRILGAQAINELPGTSILSKVEEIHGCDFSPSLIK